MFKVGQEVVFVGKNPPNKNINPPQYNEIVTISEESSRRKGFYTLKEYYFSKRNIPQYFPSYVLRPLDKDFVEKVLENVKPKEEVLL